MPRTRKQPKGQGGRNANQSPDSPVSVSPSDPPSDPSVSAPDPPPSDASASPVANSVETELPLHALSPAPFNPKKPIYGSYRKGLRSSLDYFGNLDRLKVWPIPGSPGRYYLLDGNQRLPILTERAEEELIACHFGLTIDPDTSQPAPKELKRVRDDPANVEVLTTLRRRASDTRVPVRVLAHLDPQDARLLTLVYDRNHAAYDESKVAALADEQYRASRRMIDMMARPDRAFHQPTPATALPSGLRPSPLGSDAPNQANGSVPTPNAEGDPDNPWGAPPADSLAHVARAQSANGQMGLPNAPGHGPNLPTPLAPAPTLIPMMFSFTPEGHQEISDRILRTSARLFREARLKQALEQLESACLDKGTSVKIESIVVEVALLTLGRHAEIEDSQPVREKRTAKR